LGGRCVWANPHWGRPPYPPLSLSPTSPCVWTIGSPRHRSRDPAGPPPPPPSWTRPRFPPHAPRPRGSGAVVDTTQQSQKVAVVGLGVGVGVGTVLLSGASKPGTAVWSHCSRREVWWGSVRGHLMGSGCGVWPLGPYPHAPALSKPSRVRHHTTRRRDPRDHNNAPWSPRPRSPHAPRTLCAPCAPRVNDGGAFAACRGGGATAYGAPTPRFCFQEKGMGWGGG